MIFRAVAIALCAALLMFAPVRADWELAYKSVPTQPADAFARLRFLDGTWHCVQYSSSNDPKFGGPFHEDVSYTFLAGGYWLREDTIWSDMDGPNRRVWNHAMFIGRNELYKRRPNWNVEPFLVTIAGDGEGSPTSGTMYAGWVGNDFKIFDQWGGSVTLHRDSARTIEWRYVPQANPKPAYYPNRLRKCSR